MSLKRVFLLLGVLAMVIAIAVLNRGCFQNKPKALSPARIAVALLVDSAPVFIAANEGFFRLHGVDAEIVSFSSGKDALTSVIHGTADFATVADMPYALSVLSGNTGKVVVSMSSSTTENRLIARVDRQIRAPANLIGRRIGVTPGTSGEYFLDELLVYYGIEKSKVTLVPLRPTEMVTELLSGSVDAVSTWAPHTHTLVQQLGQNSSTFMVPNAYRMYWLLVASNRITASKHSAATGIVAALEDATRYIRENPAAAQRTVARYVGMPSDLLARIWSDYSFIISLDQPLLLTLENQVRWELREEGKGPTGIPNFLKYVMRAPLDAVDPDANTLGR